MRNRNVFNIREKDTCDLLIAGSGLAGIRAAFDAAAEGLKVCWLTDGKLCSGSSFYPLTSGLGSQVADSPEDIPVYLSEVLETGCTMADPILTETVIREIAGQIEKLPEIGIHPELLHTNRPACFAKRERLLYRWGEWEKLKGNIREIFAKIPNVKILENCEITKLFLRDGAVAGALYLNEKEEPTLINCSAVLLATGGYCGLYKHSLNTKETTGTGHSIALDAGAELVNLEFMQFIPGFTKPVYKLLFSETTLRRAIAVKNAEGEDALCAYLKEEPVSFRDCLEDRAMHGPFTTEDRSRYFELAMMKDAGEHHRECGFEITFDPGIAEDSNGFIRMAREMYAPYHIDLAKDKIWLAPFAHCCNGGIRIGGNGETKVPGLYAAGETAGGIHGADRHGGMATSAALVFGHRAAVSAADYIQNRKRTQEVTAEEAGAEFAAFLGEKEISGNGKLPAREILEELGSRLWYDAGCLRNGETLEADLAWVRQQKESFDPAASPETEGLKKAMRAFHALRTAEALLCAMLSRKESRGPHCRKDFPKKDPELDGRKVILRENGEKKEIRAELV